MIFLNDILKLKIEQILILFIPPTSLQVNIISGNIYITFCAQGKLKKFHLKHYFFRNFANFHKKEQTAGP